MLVCNSVKQPPQYSSQYTCTCTCVYFGPAIRRFHCIYTYTWLEARVDNEEKKRVSNALYALCKMSTEGHVPGIQN